MIDSGIIARTAHADQVAARLREARTQHDGEVCDVLFGLCAKCRAGLEVVREARAAARIPAQRRPSA